MVALFLPAAAADLQHSLVWDLSVQGAPVGRRELVLKYATEAGGTSRIMESFTDINGQVGPIRVRYRQRLTAHVTPREPASFTSVVDENGRLMEVQGRWTPSVWIVTTTADGRSRTAEVALGRLDVSTADLMDPYTSVSIAHYPQLRVLMTESGEIADGPVEAIGVAEVAIQGVPVQVKGYAWTSPQGRSEFWYSSDGFLVKYRTQLLGVGLDAVLHDPPPGGVDDFPVAAGRPTIEALPL